ncbi:MAG: hypothetical protein JW719_05995 [Pirellulales bacterium]|nr:hypothetical protein [Pirellulales bacterium]
MTEKDPLTSFEKSLASLRPRRPRLDRDRLMFLAGQTSVDYRPAYRLSVFRPAVVSALVAAVVTLGVITATKLATRISNSLTATAAPGESRDVQPATVAGNPVQRHPDTGNALGWIASLLAGGETKDANAERPEPNLVQLREQLLEENAGYEKSQSEEP